MTVKPSQPFGKRGRTVVALSRLQPLQMDEPAARLPADLVAAIIRPAAGVAAGANAGDIAGKAAVPRSFRAALLAGLCVGFFNATLNMTEVSAVGEKIALILGQTTLPLTAIALVIGIWSGARTTALTLLVTHRILAYLGWTKPVAYALGGGAVAALFGAVMQVLGGGLSHHDFGVEFISGLGAGFFYRLFAGTVSADRA
jgi:hypothetical protein